MKELVLATFDVHKIREMRDILRDLEGRDLEGRDLEGRDLGEFELLNLHHFIDYKAPTTTGETFAENARQKALAAAKALDRAVIADDSGLIVPALKGAPGLDSDQYAGPEASAGDNRKKLLKEMAHLQGDDRSAHIVCAIAYATPDGECRVEEAISEGVILEAERGCNGHGYDCLFLKHDYRYTLAELEETIKNRISPRRKALDRIALLLEC